MPVKHKRPRAQVASIKREGVRVVAPLGSREWSVSCPTELPDRRLHDQLIVSIGYLGDTRGNAVNVGLRIGDRCVVLDRPSRSALRQLFRMAERGND